MVEQASTEAKTRAGKMIRFYGRFTCESMYALKTWEEFTIGVVHGTNRVRRDVYLYDQDYRYRS
jgi:hypothetical protein